jgi:hypothetical protein
MRAFIDDSPVDRSTTMFLAMRYLLVLSACCILMAACGERDDGTAVFHGSSPLSEYLGTDQDPILGGAGEADGDAVLAAEHRVREELIAQCMIAQGFEYVAWVPEAIETDVVDGDIEPYSRQWAERYGLGVTTLAFGQSRVGPDLVGFDDRSVLDLVIENPNDAIVASLDQATADSYFEALIGEGEPADAAEEVATPGGCVGEALADPSANVGTRFRTAFASQIDDLLLQVAGDTRVLSFEAEVAACVEDQGYDFVSYQQVLSNTTPWDGALSDLEHARRSRPAAEVDPGRLSEQEIGELADAEAVALTLGPVLTDEERATLALLQAEETEFAAALHDCGGLGEEERALRATVLRELESDFVTEHQAELESLRQQSS